MTYIPLLVTIIGVLLYALTNDKAEEIGRAMMWCGLVVVLFKL